MSENDDAPVKTSDRCRFSMASDSLCIYLACTLEGGSAAFFVSCVVPLPYPPPSPAPGKTGICVDIFLFRHKRRSGSRFSYPCPIVNTVWVTPSIQLSCFCAWIVVVKKLETVKSKRVQEFAKWTWHKGCRIFSFFICTVVYHALVLFVLRSALLNFLSRCQRYSFSWKT